MVNVLIPTKPDDTHAIFVDLALKMKGHQCTRFYTADFPIQLTHSFEINNNLVKWYAKGIDFETTDNKYDVVWYRRPKKPILPDTIHPDDKDNAKKENYLLHQSIWHVIAPHATWINPHEGASRANCKLLQLKTAANIGLKIPPTLISNDPARIKNFLQSNKNNDVVYKTLTPVMWFEENVVRLAYTREITTKDLPSDQVLQSVPGIFQKKIKKAYELRVTYCGNYPVAVKLFSQEHRDGKTDWRHIPPKELKLEPYKLPAKVDYLCREMMKKLGIVFGCFDFIVTPDGEYYFLEVNEQGQFLWIEEVNPDIKMLDIFAECLINGVNGFNWKRSASSLSQADLDREVTNLLRSAMKTHKLENLARSA